MKGLFETVVRTAEAALPMREGDIIGSDGLLRCGKCGELRQCRVRVLGEEMTVPCTCACDRAEMQAQERELARAAAERAREAAFGGYRLLTERTFERDDSPESAASGAVREYARRFGRGCEGWLILYGGCGTGKSFLAACAVNEVISRGFTARFTSVTDIERELWKTSDKAAVYGALDRFDLLVLDDYGSERETDYMREIVYDIIDGRYRARKPLIITTNLTAEELIASQELHKKRIASRLAELGRFVLLDGEDRRFGVLRSPG